MRFAAFVVAILALGLPLAVQAQPSQGAGKVKAPAKVAKPAKSPEQLRLEGLIAAAVDGDAEAQFHLGQAHRDGSGVKADAALALQWFELAAVNGNSTAAAEAAKAHESGRGVRRDLSQAGRWWHRAAELGDGPARDRWIELVLSGEVTALGGQSGVEWLTARAESGDARAMMVLAEAFEGTMDVAADLDQAERWYRDAIRLHGDIEAAYRLGRIKLGNKAAWRIPSQEEWNPKESEHKGRPYGPVWYPSKPALADDKAVQLRPGIIDAVRHLESAAHHGHAEAQFLLGKAMVGGVELPFDLLSGVIWLEAAAAQGHAEAAITLAGFAANGLGLFGKDPIRAYVLYDLAKAMGEESAAGAREAVAKTLTPRQLGRARQIIQEFQTHQGM
jgi:TPR repeat protein